MITVKINPDTIEGVTLADQKREDAKAGIWGDLLAGRSVTGGGKKWAMQDFREGTFELIDEDSFALMIRSNDRELLDFAHHCVHAWLDQSDNGKMVLDDRLAEIERDAREDTA